MTRATRPALLSGHRSPIALVGLWYQNAKSVLTVAGNPLPVQMTGSRALGEAQ